MCGIAGAAARDPGRLPSLEVGHRMCSVIRHRGPDDEGIRREGCSLLGMRRLSIIDLAGGHQPICNEDGSVWIVFNGEIYNFQELRRDLEARGHRFRTNSDTECIVHAYEEFGELCFERLRGMFALALWDEPRQRLVLARDRLGKKPLYYAHLDGCLSFGSEVKSLLEVPGMPREVDTDALHDFLLLGYVPAPASIFRSIRKLPAAHYLVYENDQVTLRPYWRLEFEPKWQAHPRELEERLAALLEDAVRVRLVSDVPFGAFLSGGIDSSVVVALMARNMSLPVKTFTIGFRVDELNELPDARLVAEAFGTEHHELVVEADAVRLLEELVWHFDEPFGDSSAIPTFLVSRLARQHVKMVLSGDGGDELFEGYARYGRQRFVEALARGGGPLAGPVLGALGMLPGGLGRRLSALGRRVALPDPERYLSGVAVATPERVGELLPGTALRGRGFSAVRAHFLPGEATGLWDRIFAGDVRSYLVDDILVKVDRMTMANSIESRAPLLDHHLVEFAARLPSHLRRSGGRGKLLLRRVAAKLLPASVLSKRKQGFAIPLAQWFRNELQPLMRDTLDSRRFRERGLIAPAAADRLLLEHVEGRADHGEQLWMILNLELWARQYLDAGTRPAGVDASSAAGPERGA